MEYTIMNEDTETGVSIIQLAKEMDAGDILIQSGMVMNLYITKIKKKLIVFILSRFLRAYQTIYIMINLNNAYHS